MNKAAINVECSKCVYHSNTGDNEFFVDVPVHDRSTNTSGIAHLKCRVTPRQHQIDLVEWSNEDGPITPSSEQRLRMKYVLTRLSEQRICGNRNICPPNIVELVRNIEHALADPE